MKKRIIILIGLLLMAATGAGLAFAGTDETGNPSNPNDPSTIVQGNGWAEPDGDQDKLGDEEDRRCRRRGGIIRRILRQLDLSERQKAAVRAILEEERPRFERLRSQGNRLRRLLLLALRGGAPDHERLARIARSQGHLTARMTVERARVWSKIYQILTPEQQRRADQILERLARRHHGMDPDDTDDTDIPDIPDIDDEGN